MDNIFDSITSDVSVCLHASLVALMLANNLLVQSKYIIDSLLTWIESFYQELEMGSHLSPKDAWILVFSCVRAYFKALRKVRSLAQGAFNMASKRTEQGLSVGYCSITSCLTCSCASSLACVPCCCECY